MYLQFYGFQEAPFNVTPDAKFLFLSHRHQEALAAMLFGVQERKGFIQLTGEIGCGKTTLCRAMLAQLDPEQVKTCVVLNSYLNDLELLKTINEGFGLESASDSKKTLLDALNEFLVQEFSEGRNVVLVIDEAQNLKPETLEQIRMISNLETETAKLIQIMLIGQPELRRTLSLPELEQLNQRITVRYHITALEEREIPEYVKHRISVARPQVEVHLSDKAFQLIHHYSRGVPRRVNVICDRALLVGYIEGTFELDDKIVERAVNELRGEGQAFMPGSGVGARRSGPSMVWIWRVGTALAALLVISVGAAMGIWLARQQTGQEPPQVAGVSDPLGARPTAPVPSPTARFELDDHQGQPVDVERAPRPEPTATAAPTVTVTATPTPTPTPTPTATPRPTPILYENWQFDPNDVLRVREPKLSEAAAYINLLRLWEIEIDLAPFRNHSVEQVANYDMLAMVRSIDMEEINFNAVETDTLNEALRLNLPLLVEVQPEANERAPYLVIESMNGSMFQVIDPIYGQCSVRREALVPEVEGVIALYLDAADLTGTSMGEESPRVRRLQTRLAMRNDYEGAIDGKFGPMTRTAVLSFQRQQSLQPTGMVDPMTAASISAELNPRGPRLY